MGKRYVLSERDNRRVQDVLRWSEREKNQRERYRRRGGVSVVPQVKIFEVQSAATGDGIYNCYEQKLDATDWDDTSGADKFYDKDAVSVEVFNLLENNPIATYAPSLALGDRIKASSFVDDEGNSRLVGMPLIVGPRFAKTTAAAGGASTIVCNLIGNDGSEITSGLGSGITVDCEISGAGDLNTAFPRLRSGQGIMVVNLRGKWWSDWGFGIVQNCACTAP